MSKAKKGTKSLKELWKYHQEQQGGYKATLQISPHQEDLRKWLIVFFGGKYKIIMTDDEAIAILGPFQWRCMKRGWDEDVEVKSYK